MKAYELVRKPFKQFKECFESDTSLDKFTFESDSLNILNYAFLNNNVEIINYLLDEHPYDLKLELNKKIDNIPLIYFVCLSYVLKMPSELDEESIVNFEKIIDFLIEKEIFPPILNKQQLSYLSFSSSTIGRGDFFKDPYFYKLIKNNYLDDSFLQFYLKDMITYFCKQEDSRMNGLFIKLITNYHFSGDDYFKDFNYLVQILSSDYSKLELDKYELKNAYNQMVNNYINAYNIEINQIAEEVLSLYLGDAIIFGEFIKSVESICGIDKNDNKNLTLKNLLLLINPQFDLKNIITKEIIEISIEKKLLNVYNDIRLIHQEEKENYDKKILLIIKNEILSESQMKDFSILEKEIISDNVKVINNESNKKRL